MSSAPVTIVVPTYNRATLLAETLRSLVQQTVVSPIVVADDASTDDTAAVCARFPGVRHVGASTRRGLFANWNRAVRLVDTELVAIFHDDDVYAPTIIERELEVLQKNPEVVFVHTACRFIDDEGRELDTFTGPWPPVMSGEDLRRTLAGRFASPIAAPAVMVRRSAVLRAGGFQEDLRVCGDIAMWMALGRVGDVGFVAEPLVAVRRRGRHANEHAEMEWTQVREHLEMAERTQREVHHGRLGVGFRARRDAYVLQFALREVVAPMSGPRAAVLAAHASAPARVLASIATRLPALPALLRLLRPVIRRTLETAGRIRRRRLPSPRTDLGSP